MDAVQELHLSQADYYGNSGETWERFYDNFDRWAADGQGDRDGLMVKLEDVTDQHRGPGAL